MTTANKRELLDLEEKVDEGFEFVKKEFAAQRQHMGQMESRIRDDMGQMKAEIIAEIRNGRE